MNILEILATSIIGALILVTTGAVVAAFVMAQLKKVNDQLNSIYGTENEIKKRIEQYVAKVARDELSKLVESYKQTLEGGSRDITDGLKNVAEAQIATLGSNIREQQALITRQSEFIVGEITKKAQEDIEDYKKIQFDGVDLQVSEIVERLSREVLGKVISPQEHERLIWEAVEKAKEQGIFKEGVVQSSMKRGRARTITAKPAESPK